LRGQRAADQPRQEIAGAELAPGQPQFDEGYVHLCASTRDTHIGSKHEVEAAAAGRAVDQRNDGLWTAPHLQDQRCKRGSWPIRAIAATRRLAAGFLEPCEVQAGAESATCAAHYDDTTREIVV